MRKIRGTAKMLLLWDFEKRDFLDCGEITKKQQA